MSHRLTMMILLGFGALFLAAPAQANDCCCCCNDELSWAEETRVVLETTAGDIVLQLHPEWSPLGVAHFVELVDSGFYDGAPWFRVIPSFVAQCGIASDPAMNRTWSGQPLLDEPLVAGNKRGYVAYGATGLPNSRTTHFYINLLDNVYLDAMGYNAFAEVVAGMENVDALAEAQYGDQTGLAAPGGLEQFRRAFPDADYILKAYVEE